MKYYHKLLFAVLLASAAIPAITSKAGLVIELGDRGYYNRGPFYVEHGRRWAWVPGHWGWHHHWVHGHYVRRY